MRTTNYRSAHLWTLGVAAVLFWAIRLPHLGYVPLWDAAEYYFECVGHAATELNFNSLNCSGHPSAAYILPFALLQKWFPGKIELINLLNSVLAFTALLLFVASARQLKDENGDVSETDLAIFAGLLAVSPFLQANTLHFNLDIGIYFFSSLLLYSVLTRRPWLVAAAGLGLVFSKETGVILFFLIVGYWLWRQKPTGQLRSRFISAGLLVTGAFLLFAIFQVAGGESFVWVGKSGKHVNPNGGVLVNALKFFDASSMAAFHTIFVINFNWLLCTVVAVALWRVKRRSTVQVVCFALLVAAVLTRYKTFNNSRYFLFIYPLILLSFCLALRDLVPNVKHRIGAAVVVGALLMISCWRTVDPVAKAVYGTFPFGSHPMLRMTSLTDECCGFGRDQIVYNLEFTNLGPLQSKLFEQLGQGSNPVLSQHEIFRRPIHKGGTPALQSVSPQMIYETLPPAFTYVLFPMIPEKADRDEYGPLLEKYAVTGDGVVEDNGYAIHFLNFKRKE